MVGLEFDQIDGLERGWLERRFEKEEILLAVNELVGDKASGPDLYDFFPPLLESGGK